MRHGQEPIVGLDLPFCNYKQSKKKIEYTGDVAGILYSLLKIERFIMF